MPETSFRMFFNDAAAKREQLDRVEEITVVQEVDRAWEARIQIPVCTDAAGKWDGEDEDFMSPSARVRVEVKVGSKAFVPLIDGPVVGRDSDLSSEPGRSSVTLVVHDDSAHLNRREEVASFRDMDDAQIVKRVFQDAPHVAETKVDPLEGGGGDDLPAAEMQRGTGMDVLRRLAARHGMHAYVLPGAQPGKSVGCFRKFAREPSDLPALVLLGPERNITEFNVTHDAGRPGVTEAYSLSITSKTVTHAKTSVRDLKLLGQEPPPGVGTDTGRRLLPPWDDGAGDPRGRVAAEAERAAFAFQATGGVLGACYGGVLRPYEVVTAKGANNRLSGNYVVKRVTHRLTRSAYSQAFSLLRDGRSGGGAAGALAALAALIS